MKIRNTLLSATMLGLMAIGLGGAGGNQGGCTTEVNNSVTNKEQAAQSQLLGEAQMQVGMPAITRFAEKRMMKEIMERRDNMYPTYTYLFDRNGHIGDLLCESLGYGLPYSTQYTNPNQVTMRYFESTGRFADGVVGQADPNGLYSPPSASGTWVLCRVPGTNKVEPQYVEPDVITLTFKKQ